MKNRKSQLLLFSLASLTFFITPLLGMERGGKKRKNNKLKVRVLRNFVKYSTSKAIELTTAIIGYIEKNRN